MRNRLAVALWVLIFVSMVPIRSISYAVPADSVEKKHKTTSTCILKEIIYATEGLGGLVGAYAGHLVGFYMSIIVMYTLYPVPESEHQARLFTERFIARPVSGLGAATGTSFVGLFFNPEGSFVGALIGSELGVAVATLLQFWYGPSIWFLLYPCASTGAVLGYNYKTFFGK